MTVTTVKRLTPVKMLFRREDSFTPHAKSTRTEMFYVKTDT